jgi:hypothetical protein
VRRLTFLLSVVAGVGVAASAVAAGLPQDLAVSDLFTGPGHMTKLAAGTTYQASEFPIALRVTPPDASWAGAEWKSARINKPPFYGWAAVGHGGTNPKVGPRGIVFVMTSYTGTPSVAATVAGLRTRGAGATYQATSPIKLAGFSGVQFDGNVVGKRHLFVPFSPPTNSARYFPDAIEAEKGEAFRLMVLNVRGKTVVVYIDSYLLPADQFPTFLTQADGILKTLQFPG